MKKHTDKTTKTPVSTETAPPEVQESLPQSNQSRLEELGDCGYEVVEGDTLWGIADTWLGEGADYPDLHETNREVIGDNADLILPGQVLDICNETLLTGESDGDQLSDELTEAAEEQRPEDFVSVAQDLFPTLDSDEDGYLSSDDLDQAMNNPDLDVNQAAALITLRRLRGELEELSNDEYFDENSGVTLADLREYQNSGELPEGLRESVEGEYARRQGRLQDASQDLFTSEDGLPDLEAMNQGSMGDCYFLAAMGSAVAQDPQAVADMIEPQEDGTYTVTFPNGQSANVAAPTLAEIGTFGSSGNDGMWVTLMEKAAGQIADPDAEVAPEALDGGSLFSRWGTQLFSSDGNSNFDNNTFTSNEVIAERMQDALDNDRTVVAHMNKVIGGGGRREGLPGGHAYSVTAFDAESNTVTLRNPWGHQEHEDADGNPVDGENDGTFTLTLEEYSRIFTGTNYSNGAFNEEE